MTYPTGRNPHKDCSEDEVNTRYPIYLRILKDYKKVEKQEDLQWSPPTRRQGRNKSLTTGRHTIGGAPPPEVI
jgi:hypothetical protein